MRELFIQAMLIGSGGFLGSVARGMVGLWFGSKGFPVATLLANGVGGLGIGVVAYLATTAPAATGTPNTPGAPISEPLRLFLAVGLLGGLTTFSTFSAETVALARDGTPGLAVLNVLANLGASLGACMLGAYVASVLAGPRGA